MRHKIKRQSRGSKPRIPATGYFEPMIEAAIRAEQRAFRVSRSFVIANCCAFALNVTLADKDTYKRPDTLRLVRGRRAS